MQTSFPTENLTNCVLNTRRYILQATKTHQISVHNARQEWNFFLPDKGATTNDAGFDKSSKPVKVKDAQMHFM